MAVLHWRRVRPRGWCGVGPRGLVEEGFVRLGGIEQWVGMRGQDRDNPALLLVHGGPGSPYSIFAPRLRAWEQHFTLVQWDQRGAGKTFGRTGRAGSGVISFDRLAADGIELAEHLRARLGHQRLILVGSSVGSIIGLLMARRRPDLFCAYVGTDQNVGRDPEQLGQRAAPAALRAAGNHQGARALERLGADAARSSRRDFDRRNRLLVKAIRGVPNMITDLILPSLWRSPGHSLGDIADIFRGMKLSLECLYEELVAFDAWKAGLRFELPFFVFQGDSNWTTPTELARRYCDDVIAPFKRFALIEKAGHLAAFSRTDQFLSLLRTHVQPWTMATAASQRAG